MLTHLKNNPEHIDPPPNIGENNPEHIDPLVSSFWFFDLQIITICKSKRMAGKPTSMSKIKQLLQLYKKGESKRSI
ncbi:hypothetical protein, partial [Membranihabitans marinus]|uniref:hypothetical protein n=1 Tax=Membranihabitans marinus TaxID=1227546 RepID=UPI001F298A97